MAEPRRRLDPAVRRLEILEAAERLLARDGDAVRVEDVAAAAGAGKGTFFHYFPTWDDLLEALRSRIFERFDAQYQLPTEVEGPIDWLTVLDEVAAAFVTFTLGQARLHDVLFHSDFARRRALPAKEHAATRLAAIIRAGQEAGDFAGLDPDPTARLLFAVMHETADAVAEGEDCERSLATLQVVMRRALSARRDEGIGL
ncbi:TetR/AcrR family transcriptional regulator [Phenylobacterium sp.]|uniref:TetR/AcrR family transcriptional regulator n=1 Tax=Phenylobacterium sp. TaxID=1871053 RepID=UPI002732F5A4|nr:TetR/AcrR family transcriptional regulator [Phenylobacterium sp.]MDP3855524.1 TetR/AcrR family transcriptional regulator [Phenylobacterium sp.]